METTIIIIIGSIWCLVVTGGYIWLESADRRAERKAKDDETTKKEAERHGDLH